MFMYTNTQYQLIPVDYKYDCVQLQRITSLMHTDRMPSTHSRLLNCTNIVSVRQGTLKIHTQNTSISCPGPKQIELNVIQTFLWKEKQSEKWL